MRAPSAIKECSQSQASERFRSGVLAKKLGGEKASGSTGFVIAISLRNSSDTRAHFFRVSLRITRYASRNRVKWKVEELCEYSSKLKIEKNRYID